MSLQNEGTVTFTLRHDNPNWAKDDLEYKFGPFNLADNLDVVAIKKGDRSLEIRIAFEHFYHTFSGPVPDSEFPNGLPVLIRWNQDNIDLWMNGEKVASAPFRLSKQ